MDNKPYNNPQNEGFNNQQYPPQFDFNRQQPPFNPSQFNNQPNYRVPPYNAPNYNGNYNNQYNPNYQSNKTGIPYNSQTPNNNYMNNGFNHQGGATPQSQSPNMQQPFPNNNTPNFNNGMSPSAVYNNQNAHNPQNNGPQYHYGNPMGNNLINNEYYKEHQKQMRIRKHHEKQLRRNGNISGAVMLGSMLFASIFSLIFLIPQAKELYDSGVAGSSILNMLYTLFAVGGSFFLFGKLYAFDKDPSNLNEPIKETPHEISFNAPQGKLKTFLIILISFGGCMVANFVSSLIMAVLQNFNIYSTYSALQDPKNAVDIILMCISTAIIPALVEEFALRGVILSRLRKYGAGFAIIASAFMFGIFHGSVAQIPFAFICGLFFGYAVIATGSIWPAIIVHFLNNSLSCVSSILFATMDETAGNLFFTISSVIVVAAGLVALYFYIKLYNPTECLKEKGEAESLTPGQKFGKFMSSPGMIIATLIFLIQALTTLTTTPPSV